ncbi:MAG: Hsp20/alpha crystallin family protein [Clostridia bacterium]|nr:Hsp20/alpha crystallin family protein [Clostridia bacterium]
MFELRPYSHRNNSLYNPFKTMDEFEKQLFESPFSFFNGSVIDEFKTDIKDEGDHYELEADLPGFDKNDIKIDINGDVMTLSAERHSEHEENDKKDKYVRCERSYGYYSRDFDLSNVKADEIKAKYENGVLKLVLPKKHETISKSRRLEIE